MILRGDTAIAHVKAHSQYFKPRELTCKCGCGLIVVDTGFLELLDQLREAVGPLRLTSFSRCAGHNAREGGAPTSDHLTGQGADVVIAESTARFRLIDHALNLGINRIGIGKSFVHLGCNLKNPQNVIWLY